MELHHLDLRLDLPFPTVLTVGTMRESKGHLEKGGLVFVATAELDPMTALSRGLGEMLLHYQTMAFHEDPFKDFRNYPYDPYDMTDGWKGWWPLYLHYLNPANAPQARWILEDSGSIDLFDIPSVRGADKRADTERFIHELSAVGADPYAVRITRPELEFTKFHAIKVMVTNMVPLAASYQNRRVVCARMETAAKASGLPCLPPGQLNDLVHPNA
jgi:hypothetical protein